MKKDKSGTLDWMKEHKVLTGIGILFILFIIFLMIPTEKTKYVCPDKSIVDVPDNCPGVEPLVETKTVTDTVIKYQCLDGSYADKKYECPTEQVQTQVSSSNKFTGRGRDVTELFYLDSGLTVFEMKYTGSSNFIVILMDDNGEYVSLLANEIDSWEGKKAIGVSAGNYLMDIDGEGSWTINIK